MKKPTLGFLIPGLIFLGDGIFIALNDPTNYALNLHRRPIFAFPLVFGLLFIISAFAGAKSFTEIAVWWKTGKIVSTRSNNSSLYIVLLLVAVLIGVISFVYFRVLHPSNI